MPRLALLALAFGALSCAQALRNLNGEEDPDLKYVRAAGGVLLKCSWNGLTAKQDDMYKREGYPWSVAGCGAQAVCRQVDDAPAVASWECRRLPLPTWITAWLETHGTLVAGEDGFRGVKTAVADQTGCPDEPVVVVLARRQRGGTATFGVQICERQFECVSGVDRHANVTDETRCTELADSAARAARTMAIDRLALETGCPASKIEAGAATAYGAERAVRLNACGRPFICTTSAGRTDCKAALDQSPAAPDAGSAEQDAGQ